MHNHAGELDQSLPVSEAVPVALSARHVKVPSFVVVSFALPTATDDFISVPNIHLTFGFGFPFAEHTIEIVLSRDINRGKSSIDGAIMISTSTWPDSMLPAGFSAMQV